MAAKTKSDTIVGTETADTIQGGAGDDTIFGTSAADKSPSAGIIWANPVPSPTALPLTALSAPGDPDHIYVAGKENGEIYRLDPKTGSASLFLDIPDDSFNSAGERGILSLAFHPSYASNGLFFVSLTDPAGDIELREYRASGTGVAFVKSILTVPHPGEANHNGGTLLFGPKDGYLYWSIGDGGSGGDPPNNAQNLNVLLGKILRLDVNRDDFPSDPARNYGIPHDNPFVGKEGADEIWDFGLRNSWRMSFDPATGDLYIGDVGQNAREEIDFEPAGSGGGRNYGWRIMEGTLGTPEPGMIPPIFDYGRDLGNVVTGGEVYRGPGNALQGAYFFADFGSGRMWTLKVVDGVATDVIDRTAQISTPDGKPLEGIASFGSDGHGNLYAVSLWGTIYHLDPTRVSGDVADRLFGGAGDDCLRGGPGDDCLGGGSGADKLFGGFGEDTLRGAGGKDILTGGAGNDTLTGGVGKDVFVFATALDAAANVDAIVDFSPGKDLIRLKPVAFPGLAEGELPAAAFFAGTAAHDPDDRIVYDPATGNLFFDADGSGPGAAIRFAHLAAGLALSSGDFLVG